MPDLADLKRYRGDERHKIILSVDLGKQQDYTAFTISEILPEARTNKRNKRTEVMTVGVRDIQRLELGTSYADIAQMIHGLFWDDRLWLLDGRSKRPIAPTLLVDAGGVGDAVCDDLSRNLGVGFIRYRLVRGTAGTNKISRGNYTVPRTRMFEMLYGAFTDNRIRINPRLRLAKALIEELRNLRPEANEETGYVRVVHREGEHDDMAICLAATNWWANLTKGQPMRLINDEATVMRLMGYPPEAIARARALQQSPPAF
jgi:hypothetical protein